MEFRRRVIKRMFDLTVTVPIAVLSLPIAAVVAVTVGARLGSPVLFRQQRAGLHGKPFTLLKFRTMHETVDECGELLPDGQRLDSFGRFLRSTSLDELPSLINVLRGEMSLVGPRPLLMDYLPLYSPEQQRRHEVLPGLTGLAQINGRNRLAWPDRLRLDVRYVDDWSLGLDFMILLRTAVFVFRREGISQEGQATSERFLGERLDVPN